MIGLLFLALLLLRVAEVAVRLACSAATVRRLCASGSLRALQLGRPGSRRPTWRIPDEAVEEFVEAGLSRPSPTRGEVVSLDALAAKVV